MTDTEKERLRTTATSILETAVGITARTTKDAKTPAKKYQAVAELCMGLFSALRLINSGKTIDSR